MLHFLLHPPKIPIFCNVFTKSPQFNIIPDKQHYLQVFCKLCENFQKHQTFNNYIFAKCFQNYHINVISLWYHSAFDYIKHQLDEKFAKSLQTFHDSANFLQTFKNPIIKRYKKFSCTCKLMKTFANFSKNPWLTTKNVVILLIRWRVYELWKSKFHSYECFAITILIFHF